MDFFSSFLRFFAVIPNVRMAPIIRNDHPAIGAVSPVPGPLLSPRTPTSGGNASPRTPTSGCTGANASPSTAVVAARCARCRVGCRSGAGFRFRARCNSIYRKVCGISCCHI